MQGSRRRRQQTGRTEAQPPAKNSHRFNRSSVCGSRVVVGVSSAIVPVSLRAAQVDVTRAYNRSTTPAPHAPHSAHLLSKELQLLCACSLFHQRSVTGQAQNTELRALAGGSRPPSTGERRGEEIRFSRCNFKQLSGHLSGLESCFL